MIPDDFSWMILEIDFSTRLKGGKAQNFGFVHDMLNAFTLTDSVLGYQET